MKLWLALSALGLAGGLCGCSVDEPSTTPTGHVSQYQFDPALCTTLLPATGFQADMSDLNITRPIQSPYFEKRYNRAMLEGVLSASGSSTQKYVKASGIDVYKIAFEEKKNTCLFQYELPIANDQLYSIWESNAGGDHGGGHLDGLFVAFSNGRSMHEVIMVREDSSRWTLVHEMMHANFFRQRLQDGKPGGENLKRQVKRAFEQLNADYSAYQTAPTSAVLDTLVAETDSLAHLLYQSLSAGSLEEIADESLLLKEWSDGRLQYVSENSARNAAWYIDYARTLSLKDLNDFSDVVSKMLSKMNSSVIPRFRPTFDFIQSVNAQTDDLAKKAREEIAHLGAQTDNLSLMIGTAHDRAHVEAANSTPAMLEFRSAMSAFLSEAE